MNLQHPIPILRLVLLACLALSGPTPWARAQEPTPVPQRAFLGVELGDGSGCGVLVTSVVPLSAAESAGLRVDDRLLGVDGSAADAPADVLAVMDRHAAGDSVQLVFRRGEAIVVRDVTLGARAVRSSGNDRRIGAVLKVLQVEPGQVVADIGFGSGWLSEGIAVALGPKGRVYAVEVDETRVRKMQQRGLPNVEVIHSKPDDVSLPPASLDRALLHDVASHVKSEARPKFYASVALALKPDGQLVVFGPHGEARAMLEELVGFGFHAEDAAELAKLTERALDERLEAGLRFSYREESDR